MGVGQHGECCELPNGYKYPATECSDQYKTCHNTHGHEFFCADNDQCCGDICVGQHGECCTNSDGNNFACGEGSTCCGNACAAPGSKCCELPNGYKYPATECSDQYKKCHN